METFPLPASAAIIQPYFFPYIGYFQLLYSVEKVVFYDDVNFIKRGWINRNRILMNQSDFIFTLPLKKASQNKQIQELEIADLKSFQKKFRQQLKFAYSKAPFYHEVSKMIESVLDTTYNNIADIAIESVLSVFAYLNIEIDWMKSSTEFDQTHGQEKADRLINISKQLDCDTYINPIGGKELYSKEYFKLSGIELGFVQTGNIEYKQFDHAFVPCLSIIDLLMFNDKDAASSLLIQFQIV
ncbi:WbqC family protein [Marinifilum caeruleilacunae]|uniref:WbqC family protein n=1 Tax=Marinifilum caeruleilacunae TaxID=2499076 RepID=UPI0014925D20